MQIFSKIMESIISSKKAAEAESLKDGLPLQDAMLEMVYGGSRSVDKNEDPKEGSRPYVPG